MSLNNTNNFICLISAGKSHLQGKPYHISALYVVDLEKFRKDRVGDILRAEYQALSADPGSLANLDQDLPNYAQHRVPIFSLPQEWLWCESWCSNETKADSKTIDLCNNPLHKEPKVSMAKVNTGCCDVCERTYHNTISHKLLFLFI